MKFKLRWKGSNLSNHNVIEGDDILDALVKADYGVGAMSALASYEEVNEISVKEDGSFPRMVLPERCPLDSKLAEPYLELAAMLAQERGLPIHLQDPNQFTMYIVYP